MLLEKRSSNVSSIPWKIQRTCVSWANSSVGTLSCPTSLGRPAGRLDPTRPWYVRVFPGHTLHEKGLQRQEGVGPLVSSQEQRALLVPRLNRGLTAGFVPPSVYIRFRLFVLLGKRRDVSSMLWRVRGKLVSWADSSVGIQSCPTPPRHPAVLTTPVKRPRNSAARKFLVREARGVQRREAALRGRSAARGGAAAARGMALGGARIAK